MNECERCRRLEEALRPFAALKLDGYGGWLWPEIEAAQRALAPEPQPEGHQGAARREPVVLCDCGLMIETHTTLTGAPREHKPTCATRSGVYPSRAGVAP